MSYPTTPHKNYFFPNNEFMETRTLSKGLIEKSISFFRNILKLTNTIDKESTNQYKDDFWVKSKNILEQLEQLEQDSMSVEDVFFISTIKNYSIFLDEWLFANNIKSIFSNEKQVKMLSATLNEIFSLQDHKYNGLGQVWALFSENIDTEIQTFAINEREMVFFSATHLKSVKERNKPIKWGWFEIHFKCFVDGLISSLEKEFTTNSNLDKHGDNFLHIYNFSIEINKKIKDTDYGVKTSKGFSTLGDFLNSNQKKLENSILFHYDKLINESFKSSDMVSVSKNRELETDFIDFINGKNREEKGKIFNELVKFLMKKNIVRIEDDKLTFNRTVKGNRAGVYLAGFFKTCDEKQIIRINEFCTGEHIKQCLIITFNLNPKGISSEQFKNKKYQNLDKTYMEPYKFLPNIKELREQMN